MAKTKAERKKDDDLLAQAKEHYKLAVQGWQHIYDDAADDTRFVYDIDGGQWPAGMRKEREKDGRPVITVNKLQKFVRQQCGEQRMNRPRMNTIPVDSKGDPAKAQLYNGLIRQIEYLSDAGVAYDTAYKHSLGSSIGFFRIITEYAKGNTFDQDIKIKRVTNPTSVHLDPAALDFQYEDGEYGFYEEMVSTDEYKRLYPKATVTDFDGNRSLFGDWLDGDKVRVAEYFWKKPIEREIVQLESGEVISLEGDVTEETIIANGDKIKDKRTVYDHKVMWYKLSGAEILERAEWPGRFIPLIPMLGDEVVVDGKRHYLSLVRGAKDIQMMYNYWMTAATENVALSPKNPFIVEAKQIEGYEGEWEEAHRTNRPYIRYNAVQGLNKPSKEPQTQVPNAIINMAQTTAYDIEDHLGRYESSKGETSNERSGKAITARINQSDKGTYTFVDNYTRAIICGCRQIIDLIPKIYDTERAIRIMDEKGEQSQQMINTPTGALDANGDPILENDLTVGEYDIIASVATDTRSQREEMVGTYESILQYGGDTIAPMIIPLMLEAMDAPGAKEAAGKISEAMQAQQQAAQGQPQ